MLKRLADKDPRLLQAYRIVVCLAAGTFGLSAIVGYLMMNRAPDSFLGAALQDPETRQQVIAQLVADSAGIYDSHNDADVGRVLAPSQKERDHRGVAVSTNRYGMRERNYELPKPKDVLRIVLLGDSMVYGLGAAAEDRLGVHLEQWLRQRSPTFTGRIECLHLGIPSWNIQTEAAYLRRQLNELRPDLVIHIIVRNDLAETAGTRGFGEPARFSPQHRYRADSLITAGFPQQMLGFSSTGFLRLGLDYESQSRYRAAAEDLQRLAKIVEDSGSPYRLLVNYRHLLPIARKYFGQQVGEHRIVYLSKTFGRQQDYFLADGIHWNREGHAAVAQLIYGLVLRDSLLPGLALEAWDDAVQLLKRVSEDGRTEAMREPSRRWRLRLYDNPAIASSLDFTQLNAAQAAQIHGGVDREGRVSPYASVLLKNDGGQHLRLVGTAFSRPELDGGRVRVFVDAEEVGQIQLRAGDAINGDWPLPAATSNRPFLSVRLVADDYIYVGPDLQHCVVFQLHQLAIET